MNEIKNDIEWGINMVKIKTTLDILKFIYITQFPSKKIMRSLGSSYDFTGRKIKQLINEGIILETKIQDINTLTLSKKGIQLLSKEIVLDKELDKKLRTRIKGEKNKIRQSKLAMSIQMLNSYIPNYIDDYIDFEKKLKTFNFNNQIARQDKIENVRNEIFEREQRSQKFDKCWFISFKEIRDLDKTKLKNIPSTRTNGIFHTSTGDYAIYNHYKKRMKCYGNFELIFNQFAEEVCDKPLDGAIHFASSFQVLLDTILKTPDGQKDSYIISSLIYPKQFYVPLTSDGIKQLQIYQIKDFRNKIRNALIKKDEIRNAENLIIDGYSNDTISNLGFECDYNETEILYKNMNDIFLNKKLILYCFPHQAYFYEQLFNDFDVEIKTIKIEDVISFLEKKGER